MEVHNEHNIFLVSKPTMNPNFDTNRDIHTYLGRDLLRNYFQIVTLTPARKLDIYITKD
jgi:hypothetical protein